MNYSEEIIKVAKTLKADAGDVPIYFTTDDFIDRIDDKKAIEVEVWKPITDVIFKILLKHKNEFVKQIKDEVLKDPKVKKLLEDEKNNIKAI